MKTLRSLAIGLFVILFTLVVQAKDFKGKFRSNHTLVKKMPIIFHEKYDISFMGIENLHSFDSKKYGKVFNTLCKNLNLTKDNFYRPDELDIKDLELVHSNAYLELLNKSQTIAQISEIYPLKFLPNFILQKFVLTPMKYATSGTVLGASLALQHGWAINLSGGYHHAKANSGEGFCFFADIPLAVYKLHKTNPKLKVMVIDLDAHQGNGYESIFKDDKRIVTFDVYNGEIYPHDLYAKQFIKYDYPVKSFIKDEEYLNLIRTKLPKAIKEFKPNLIIYNAGTDIFSEDPLGRMSVSKNGIIERDSFVFNTVLNSHIPILMVLSGGYSKKSAEIISESVEKIVKNIENKKKYYKNTEITPLMQAVIDKDINKIKQLIREGENVDAVAYCDQPRMGYPVLKYAIDTQSLEIVKILLEANADPNNLTTSPIITKDMKSNVRNISLLSHAINSNSPINIISELIKFRANIDGSPKCLGDWSTLMIAAYRGYTDAVLLLLDKGADLSAVNSKDRKTALDYAKEQNHITIVDILSKHLKK